MDTTGAEAGAQGEEYPSAPVEDGSAPVRGVRTREKRVAVWEHVACGRCREDLTPVFPDQAEDGAWESLQAEGALQVTLSGGYGMYVDPIGSDPTGEVLLCKTCTEWLRSEIPGVDMALKRLERW